MLENVADYPEFAAAANKLTDLETRLNVVRAELRGARDSAHDQTDDEAVRSLLAGGAGTAIASPSIPELSQAVRLLERAVESQRRSVDEVASRIEREASTSERKADDQDTLALIKHLEAAFETIGRRQQRRSSIRQRFAGHCSLPDLALQHDFTARMKAALDQFKNGASHFGVSGK